MLRSRQAKRIIDYRIFHRTGEKVDKVVLKDIIEKEKKKEMTEDKDKKDMVGISMSGDRHTLDEKGKLILQLETISDDIGDFKNENPIEDM